MKVKRFTKNVLECIITDVNRLISTVKCIITDAGGLMKNQDKEYNEALEFYNSIREFSEEEKAEVLNEYRKHLKEERVKDEES